MAESAVPLSNEEHLRLLTQYGLTDAMAQGRVLPPLLRSIQKYQNQKAFRGDSRTDPIVRDMGELGFLQCKKQGRKFYDKTHERREDIKTQIFEASQGAIKNPKSPKQVAGYIYEKRGLNPVLNTDGEDWEEGDSLAVSRPALFALEECGVPPDVSTLINLLVQYGSLSTLISGNIRRVFRNIIRTVDHGPRQPHPADPKYGTWLQPAFRRDASTGRLVSNPNVQNYTKLGFFNTRTLFRAPPGHVFVSIDGEQLELRFYAGESGDEYYTRAFMEGLDAHSLNVVSLISKTSSEGALMKAYTDFLAELKGEKGPEAAKKAKDVRTLYKSVVFSMLYGAGWEKVFTILARNVDKSDGRRLFPKLTEDIVKGQQTIREVYTRFREVHPWLEKWHERVDDFVMFNRFVEESFGGRRFVFAEGTAEPNQARNFTIQAAAASYIDRCMIEINDAFAYQSRSRWTGLVTQCHDELVLCVPEKDALEACNVCEEAFRREFRGIPLMGEAEVTRYYGAKGLPREEVEAMAA